MEDVGIFYGHLSYFTSICIPWYIFSRFGMLYQEKSGNLAGKPNQNDNEGLLSG
jgi:hypothetical protein